MMQDIGNDLYYPSLDCQPIPIMFGEEDRDIFSEKLTSHDFEFPTHHNNWNDDCGGIFGLVDSAQEIISCNQSIPCDQNIYAMLEPTPIGPNGVQKHVEEIQIDDSDWQDPFFWEPINPVLSTAPSFRFSAENKRAFEEDEKGSEKPKAKRQCLSSSTEDKVVPRCTSPLILSDEEDEDDITENNGKISNKKSHRPRQSDQWNKRFQELIDFKKLHGHCMVPHNNPSNPKLWQWVKRQRYQYKLKTSNRHSTLSDVRQKALEDLGFIWDSHKSAWSERLEALKVFRTEHGHCNVPSNHSDRVLAIWVKCQRRQYKLYTQGETSTMTEERFLELDSMGFDWNPRNLP